MSRTGGGIPEWLRTTKIGQFLSVRLGAFYIRLCRHTIRWTVEGQEEFDAATRRGAVISSMWHGRLFISPCWAPPGRSVAMISNNRDGDLIAGIVGRFGIEAVRGSTYDRAKRRDKGGAQAFHRAERALADGAVVGITPDGPRGPRMRAQSGVAQLSAACRCPVVPVGFSASRGRILHSWDRFLVPYPFCRGALVFGPPMEPPEESDHEIVEAFRQQIEDATTAATNRADDLCGRPHILPMEPKGNTGGVATVGETSPRAANTRPAE